ASSMPTSTWSGFGYTGKHQNAPLLMANKSSLLLFVHGLGGDAIGTWRGFPELINRDGELSSRFDVGFFQFPTSLVRLPFSKKFPRIQTLASALKTQINNTFNGYQSIKLVCHSLGGLIARRYL